MALARFTRRALEQLADHDAWRLENGWEPIALEIYDAVQAYFGPHNPDAEPHFLPGKPARLDGEPVDLRMVTITVRSKPFLVFYDTAKAFFRSAAFITPGLSEHRVSAWMIGTRA